LDNLPERVVAEAVAAEIMHVLVPPRWDALAVNEEDLNCFAVLRLIDDRPWPKTLV
jgi:hypothetical protein